MTTNLPWVPLFSTLRSEQLETTIYGLLAITTGESPSILHGDSAFRVWGRSLLKPWQLLVIYPTLKRAYPQLKPAHYALMMASQQSDPHQVKGLQEMLAMGELSVADLQCPACSPMKESNKSVVGTSASSLNHPCAGKHIGYLLYCKAKSLPFTQYLNSDFEPYQQLRDVFSVLFNRDFSAAPETQDGCGMPNMGLTAIELAQLYQWLAISESNILAGQMPTSITSDWNELAGMMRQCPEFVGGMGRLDTRLMQQEWLKDIKTTLVAKEGADGLLAIGVGYCSMFPQGLGILIKLASGYEPSHLDTIIFQVLKQLQFPIFRPRAVERNVRTVFEF